MTITEFLLARIEEDVEALPGWRGGSWEAGERCVWRESPICESEIVSDGPGGEGGAETPEIADHIARHDPDRVLREIEAKRAIVEDYLDALRCAPTDMSAEVGRVAFLCALRALAAVYADHPDYNPEWAA